MVGYKNCRSYSVHSPPGSPPPAHITPITVTFALTIYHSLGLSLQT